MREPGTSFTEGMHLKNERHLIEQARRGDEAAFTLILRHYQRPILGFVYRMTGDADAANDLAQNVFVHAWKGLPRFTIRDDAAFSTWLFQIARNVALDDRRRRSRRPPPAAASAVPAWDQMASRESVTDTVVDRELGAAVATAVAGLPEDQRAAVVLADYEGLPARAIAAIMRCSVKAVEARRYRARQTLRRVLADFLP